MILNQQHQADVDGITPMPTDRVDDSSLVKTSSAEAVVWYYSNSGVWATASGQAAGTMCAAKLTYTGVLNGMGSAIGLKNDTSFSFAASTRADTLVEVPEEAFSKMLKMTVAEKVVYIAKWLTTNGYYAIDHRRGEVWLLTKADPTNDAATYKYSSPISSGAVGSSVIITDGSDDAAVLARTTGTEQPAVTDNALVVYDVGGGAATASSQYRATTNGQDGTVVYAGAQTLTLTGTPATVNSEDIVYIREVDATGNTAALFVNGAGGVHIEISGSTVTKSGGTDFSANGVYELGYNGQDKAYSAAANANQIINTTPVWTRSNGSTIAEVTNETDGTNYYYIDMTGYQHLATQYVISGGSGTMTVTVEGSKQDDGTAAASCTYNDVTNAAYGVANWTASGDYNDTAGFFGNYKYVRIKTVSSTGGSNDADITIYGKQWF